jgi:hypothetical protein
LTDRRPGGDLPLQPDYPDPEHSMYLIREIMHCKPGKVRSMVDKFKAMSALSERMGMPSMRVLTDFAGDQFWTVVAEMEVSDLQKFEEMMSGKGAAADDMKKMEEIMQGYHDLVESGRREIYRIES